MNNHISDLIDAQIRADGYAGAAVVVKQRGVTIYSHYAGNAATGLPAAPDVLWPLASISKLHAVTAVVKLMERGLLTGNTLASAVLPCFTGDGREDIRLRHLLTHTSGLIYQSPVMDERLIAQVPLSGLIEEAYHAPLLYAPGNGHSYADYNTLIASHMASVVTGVPFDQLVRDLVLTPMGLADTRFPPAPADFPRIAQVRGVMAEGTAGAMYNSPHALTLAHPAFGVVASVEDLAKFGAAFSPSGHAPISGPALRAMLTNQTGGAPGMHVALRGTPADTRTPWGFGWMLQTGAVPCVLSDFASQQAFGHGGASGCQLVVDPVPDLVVAFVSNSHVLLGRDAWQRRIQSVMNAAFCAFG